MTALSPVMLEQHLNCPEKQVELPLRGDSVCSDRYIGRDYLAREYANVWHKIWNIGGVAYQMPESGDYLTTELGIDSVILVRQDNGSVRAFLNSCPHRGTRITEAEDGHTQSFSCPYHGWKFDINGNCI